MTGFLDLPSEIRVMVYRHVFHDQAVKFLPGLKVDKAKESAELASSAALLICSKVVYYDSQPFFYEMVRVDISEILDKDAGILRIKASPDTPTTEIALNIQPALLHHVKISQSKLDGEVSRKFIRSLKNLISLNYYGLDVFYFDLWELADEEPFDCLCRDCRREQESMILTLIKHEVNGLACRIIGRCFSGPSLSFDPDSHCFGEKPVRSVVAAWAWNGMPFKLIAEIKIKSEDGVDNMVSPP
jgi:hypothetical protein